MESETRTDGNWRPRWQAFALAVALCMPLATSVSSQGDGAKTGKTVSTETPPFTDAEAVHLMNEMRQALESNHRTRLLKIFDARRMPNYPAFRDQVSEFFERYDSFQVQYHVTEVRNDGQFGAVLADVVLEAAVANGNMPDVRRSVQMRLVTAWDGKQWKIVDLTPRSLFQ